MAFQTKGRVMLKLTTIIAAILLNLTACQANESSVMLNKDEQAMIIKTTAKQTAIKKLELKQLNAKNKMVEKRLITTINTQAIIHYFNFEGGFYGIVTESGQKLLPINLAKNYQQAGTVVKIKGKLLDDMITIQQWGKAFKISDIELVKSGDISEQ
jgi:hypothetical protein